MRRKFIGALLFGTLLVGSTSTFVSCKDYDDDINDLKSKVESNTTTLESVKTSLTNEIASLKTQLEAADAELQTAIDQKADASTVTALQSTVSNLETRIATAESAISDINSLLASKVDQTTYDAAIASILSQLGDKVDKSTYETAINSILTSLGDKVDKSAYDLEIASIWAKVNAVDTDLATALQKISTLENGLDDEKAARLAVAADLAQQAAALDKIEALYDDNTKISELKSSITTILNNIGDTSISQLKTDLQNLSDSIDALNAQINVLNVLIKDSLRSLVFRPDAYYWGVEATKVYYLDYYKYTLPTTAWNNCETSTKDASNTTATYSGKGYEEQIDVIGVKGASRTVHARYDSAAASKILDFVACYHMNPSNADIKSSVVSVLSDDKEYINTRAAACGLSVKDWSTEAGMLKVNLNVNDPSLIKTVPDNSAITVFATSVNIKKGGDKDTTITSDYATLYKESIKDIRLAHRSGSDVPSLGVENTHCGECSLSGNLNHLMATVYEAKTFDPQDYCLYNSELDLTKLVETHYTTVSGKHALMTADDLKAAGLEYQFELTGLYLGGNKTSESAHAAISGTTFRPQMPAYDENNIGIQQAYGATQDRQEIGRTPLVRVKLVDTESGNVLDYGYIRIKITEKAETPAEDQDNVLVEYTGDGWSYNYECSATGWSYQTKWIQTEYDLYNMLGMTREEFEANYSVTPVPDNDNGDLQQYMEVSNKPGTYVKAAQNQRHGSVTNHNDASSEDGTLTSTLRWTIQGSEMLKVFGNNTNAKYSAIIKYESKNLKKYPDVYVKFNVGSPITINKPSAEADLASNKNANYWYTWNNASDEGFDEVHSNTLTPEDNAGGTAVDLDNRFSDLFVGNNFIASTYVKNIVDNTAGKEYAASKLNLDFRFSSSNNGKEFKGYTSAQKVATYVLSVGDNGKGLYANIKGSTTKQKIAEITGTAINDQKVEYVHSANNDGYAESMLNYKAHNELADDVINAIVGLYADNGCHELTLSSNEFNVRFLRPLNVASADKEIEDASTTALQVVKMADLVKFTDWRDAWNDAKDYFTYYGIKAITIEGVKDNERISQNEEVMSNQHYAETDPTKFVSLKSVNDQVDFYYHKGATAKDDYLEYRNFSSTVTSFQVQIPVTVEYIWGKIYTTATVTVKRTASNAKNH